MPGMKRSPLEIDNVRQYEGVAGWGTAKLIRWLDGRYELQDGSEQDRKEAMEWVNKFMTGDKPVRWRV